MADVKNEVLFKMSPSQYNPRKISTAQLDMLKKSMIEYGDLSGIVVNRTTGNIIGGHQRVKIMDGDYEILGDKIKTAYGEFSYREVDWEENKEKLANIAANKHGGEWDTNLLKDLFIDIDYKNIDIDLSGFSYSEIDKLFAEKTSGRGNSYNDDKMQEIEFKKLGYRIESFLNIKRGKCIELFAGRGALTSWYERSFDKVITNDKQNFSDCQHDYNLSASKFIKNILKEHLDFNFIDFDDEGCPAKEIQEFFSVVKNKTDPFVIAITDGQGLNLKCKGKINFQETYLTRENKTVQASTKDYYSFVDIFRNFIKNVTLGFECSELSLYLKDNGNVIYATYFLQKCL